MKAKWVQSILGYTDALRAIWDRSGYDRGFISNPFAGDDAARLGLVRTQLLLDRAGFTELPFATIHVAGSKGKGSTCTMVDAILHAGGIRTGRYLSPHLHSFRERFMMNNTLITESDFTSLTHQFTTLAVEIEQSDPQIGRVTAFELTTAMALAWFAQQGCDVAVIEVGLGGELDATNIVSPTVSVITTLDYEHTAILGATMTEIARNKAGIIKPNRPVVSAVQPAEGMGVIEDRAVEMHAPLTISSLDFHVLGPENGFTFTRNSEEIAGLKCSLAGPHQVENAGLAIAAILTLGECEPTLAVTTAAIRAGLAAARLPGRFEQIILDSGQMIVIDGAHTPASATALAHTVQDRFPDARIALVIGMLTDKQPEAILAPLQAITSHWIAVAPNNPRALSPGNIRAAIKILGNKAEIAASVAEGIDLAKHTNAEVILVTGSFTTTTEARIALGLAEVVDPPVGFGHH